VPVGNSGSSGLTGSFAGPDPQDCFGGGGERDGAVPAALAQTVDVGASAEGQVATVEPDQLGDAQPGLDGGEQQRPVTSAFPLVAVRGVDDGVDLLGGEE
jgi:hypothetical protein